MKIKIISRSLKAQAKIKSPQMMDEIAIASKKNLPRSHIYLPKSHTYFARMK